MTPVTPPSPTKDTTTARRVGEKTPVRGNFYHLPKHTKPKTTANRERSESVQVIANNDRLAIVTKPDERSKDGDGTKQQRVVSGNSVCKTSK